MSHTNESHEKLRHVPFQIGFSFKQSKIRTWNQTQLLRQQSKTKGQLRKSLTQNRIYKNFQFVRSH
jgi:hypothetical protein